MALRPVADSIHSVLRLALRVLFRISFVVVLTSKAFLLVLLFRLFLTLRKMSLLVMWILLRMPV